MLAYCDICKIVFDSPMILAGMMGQTISITNVTVPCTNGGHSAKILDGKFQFDGNGIPTMLSGPDFTKDVLEKLKKLAETAKAEKYSTEQFIKEAEKISPNLSFLSKYAPKDFADLMLFLTLLWAVISFFTNKDGSTYYNQRTVIVESVKNDTTSKIKPDKTSVKNKKKWKKNRK